MFVDKRTEMFNHNFDEIVIPGADPFPVDRDPKIKIHSGSIALNPLLRKEKVIPGRIRCF